MRPAQTITVRTEPAPERSENVISIADRTTSPESVTCTWNRSSTAATIARAMLCALKQSHDCDVTKLQNLLRGFLAGRETGPLQ
jgi:hypothetical protein